MSLAANIDHLQLASGIHAVCVQTEADGVRTYRGDDHWHRVLDRALDLFKLTDERSIRVVVGSHTVVVQNERDQTAAVALPTGHPIAKSLRRMIRRMSKKARGPLPVAQPRASSPSAQPGTGAVATPPSTSSSLLF